jgi:hypothetical protein
VVAAYSSAGPSYTPKLALFNVNGGNLEMTMPDSTPDTNATVYLTGVTYYSP